MSCALLEGVATSGDDVLLHAQNVTADAGLAATTFTVRFDIASRLTIAADGGPRVIANEPGSTLLDLPVRVRANVRWRLLVSHPAAPREDPEMEVLDCTGAWRPLSMGAVVAVTDASDPTNLSRFSIRLRLRRPGTLADDVPLRLELESVERPL